MLRFYKTGETAIEEIEGIEAGCWISATAPTEAEITRLETDLGIDRDFIRSALDEEESSRIENDEGQTLIVLDYPVAERMEDDDQTFSYYTMPMGIILTDSYVITVSLKENSNYRRFCERRCKKRQNPVQNALHFLSAASYRGEISAILKTNR